MEFLPNKKNIIFVGPFFTRSGYGTHSRLMAKSLISMENEFNVKFFPTKWGTTPENIDTSDPSIKSISDRILKQINYTPDIFIQCTIPSEFQPIGRFNIGITAGTESAHAPISFIEGCNKMDLILTPSKFTSDVLKNTKYDKRDNNSNQIVGTIELTKPIDILFEGIDLSVYNQKNIDKESEIWKTLNKIPTDFNFLFVGHWLQGNLGQDRKDVGMLVKSFIDLFKRKGEKNRPGLILKTSGAGFSITERDQIIHKINQIQEAFFTSGYIGTLPNIYVLNGDLSEKEMNSLYRHPKVSAMVSFTKAEGYGLPLAEFATTGKPILCSNYSGHIDFLKNSGAILLPGSMTKIDSSSANDWIVKDSEWFTVNYAFASNMMNEVFEKYKKTLDKSKSIAQHIRKFSLEEMSKKFLEILEKDVNLWKTELKSPQINLPKLKKIS